MLQGDGKIVAAGDYGLVRLNPDGTTDDSFVTDPPYTDPRSFAAVALQTDGRIIIAGHEYNYATDDSDFFVAAYKPDGSRDETFSGDGIVTMDFGGHDDRAKAVVVQPDGRIGVAGYSVELDTDDVPSRDFALARYDPDGTLDDTFSGDGKRTTNLGQRSPRTTSPCSRTERSSWAVQPRRHRRGPFRRGRESRQLLLRGREGDGRVHGRTRRRGSRRRHSA